MEPAGERTFACALDGESVVHLRGASIAEFLQGQLTCDTRNLSRSRVAHGALCNPRGRVLADVAALALADDHVALRLRSAIAESCAATLGTYARFSRIDCQADPGEWALLGICGPGAMELAARLGFDPARIGDGMDARGDHYCYASGADLLEVLAPAASIPQLLEKLPGDALAPESAWRAGELRRGKYRIEPEDVGEFTPQALNYDLAGLVSFSKGCYTGQEVVARLHYRGQAKRRLALLRSGARDAPARGEVISDSAGERVGSVLRSACDPDGHWLLGVELRVDAHGEGDLLRDGETLQRIALPYEIPVPGAAP